MRNVANAVGRDSKAIAAAELKSQYRATPLTIEASNPDVFAIVKLYADSADSIRTIKVSTNNGDSWTEVTSSVEGTVACTLAFGKKALFAGDIISSADSSDKVGLRIVVSGAGSALIYGNVMSLLDSKYYPAAEIAPKLAFCGLFAGTSSRTNNIDIPDDKPLLLPATFLAQSCYRSMFAFSTITKAPELPALRVSFRGYERMFYYCTALRHIKCLATDISDANALNLWCYHVPEDGTFIKADGMADWPSGAHGIPVGWTVKNASEE